MCICRLPEPSHWWVELTIAAWLYQIATSPEEAEYYLRSWAAKIVRKGHMYVDTRALAARILATKNLHMVTACGTVASGVLETPLVTL